MDKFTIVFFTYHDFQTHEITGGTRRLIELIEGFKNLGVNVVLFSPKSDVISKMTGVKHFELKYKRKSVFPLGLVNFIINFSNVRKKLIDIKYEKSIAIDVPYGIQMKYFGFKNVCFIVWQDFVNYRDISFKDNKISRLKHLLLIKLYKIAELKVLKYVNRIIVQCNYDVNILKSRHENLVDEINNKTYVIPNNINPSWMCDNTSIITMDVKAKKKFIISFIGNINDSRKGLHFLLEAFTSSKILKEYCILRVIGGGTKLSFYENYYKNYSNIEFLGYKNNPLPILYDSNLLVVPSVADSFPNTILEALFFDIPVIGSNRGGIPEVLLYDELLFELNVDDLKVKMENLLKAGNYEKILEKCSERKKQLSFDWVKGMLQIVKNE